MRREMFLTESSPENGTGEIPVETFLLANGIRLVHRRIESPVAYCALMINAGSRDELADEYGVAHLAEHLLFKETRKRKTHHILGRMENVGGELNAYTAKEETCIHAAFLCEHYARTLELFSDIVFNCKITDKTLELEKNVIIDEIKSSQENPSELIFDEFDELLFPGHPLGRNTLGTIRSVNKLDTAAVERFIHRQYRTDRMVLTSVGKISLHRLIIYAEKYFGGVSSRSENQAQRQVPPTYIAFNRQIHKKNHQAHCVMGAACDATDKELRLMTAMLANLLGGPGMTGRLNMSLRERNGWVYHVEASYTPYSDVGVFNIYFGTDKNNLEKCIKQIEKELFDLKEKPLTGLQLKKLQQQVIGQLAIASDNNDAQMLSAGKNMLMFDKVDSLHDICVQINEIKSEHLCEVSRQVFGNLSSLIYL